MAYKTSKAFADPKPLVVKTGYHIKHMTVFRKDISDLVIDDDEIMNSHDVVSLFTNVPIQIAMDVIRKRFVKDKNLSKHTDLSPNIMSLVKSVMSMTYFQFKGELYQQVYRVSMESLSGGGGHIHGRPGTVRHEQHSYQREAKDLEVIHQ